MSKSTKWDHLFVDGQPVGLDECKDKYVASGEIFDVLKEKFIEKEKEKIKIRKKEDDKAQAEFIVQSVSSSNLLWIINYCLSMIGYFVLYKMSGDDLEESFYGLQKEDDYEFYLKVPESVWKLIEHKLIEQNFVIEVVGTNTDTEITYSMLKISHLKN